MTLKQLLYFKKTAECRTITQAAAALYIAQPSLSVALKKLEEEAGAPLLRREGHMLLPTEAGKIVLSYAKKMLQLSEELEQELAERRTGEQQVNFGYITPLSQNYVPALIADIEKRFGPALGRINASVMDTRHTVEALNRGDIDFGLCCRAEDGGDALVQKPVLTQPLVAVCSVQHALAEKYGGSSALPVEELARYDLISYSRETQIYPLIAHFFEKNRISPKIKYTMNSEQEILRLVKKNLGISLIALTDDLDRSEIFSLPLQGQELSRSIYLTYRADRKRRAVLGKLLRFIENKK